MPMKYKDDLDDAALLELIQRQTFRYFWDFAHPISKLARDRSDPRPSFDPEVVATGASGFGIMAIIVAVERGWISRTAATDRLLGIVHFLEKAQRHHGVFPHFMHGTTGATIPFSGKDDGGDIVETSYLCMGLLSARQYFARDTAKENKLRAKINALWQDVEWSWHTRGGAKVLYWHWSPRYAWDIGLEIRGWNECLIAYVLAASSPSHPIAADAYHRGWAAGAQFKNGKEFYGVRLPLGPDYGGPLCFAHYSFLGLHPRGLKDCYADYWEQNVNHTLINREHCIRNPSHFKGYGRDCWGLTASDDHLGYHAHDPAHDLGVITPTAALSSFPYTPEHSMRALRHFYHGLGAKIWGDYGFFDGFSETSDWYASSHTGIDQGPIIVMIENYRSGLLWKLFMSCPEVQRGLRLLDFESPAIS
ncbi:MAG: beta-glucosidase [Hyphomicrobium sp.]|nr:MAG: beta-glucosidase [Hyphomicrobium sp.]